VRSYGNVRAGGPVGMRGVDIPLQPRPSGRDVLSDLERAHTPGWRIPTIEPEAPTVITHAENRCTACREGVHTISARGWCDWCEQQAAATLVTTPAPTPAALPGQPAAAPPWVAELTQLLVDTEAHPDPTVAAARKVLANAAVALRAAHRKHQGSTDITAKNTPRPARPRAAAEGPVADAVVRLYTGELLTVAAIAERLHLSKVTVRAHLNTRKIELRDDRTTGSGGGNARTNDPAFTADVSARYIAGATIREIATAVHTGEQQVSRALHLAGVPIRAAASREPTGGLSTRAMVEALADAGVTTSELRAWARTQGITVPARGLLPMGVLNAWRARQVAP
jgi:hypothetical protein